MKLQIKELTLSTLALPSFEKTLMEARETQWRQTYWHKVVVIKEEYILEEVVPVKTFKLKELSEIFHNTKSAKGKILEADPNFERYTTTYQDIKKHSIL